MNLGTLRARVTSWYVGLLATALVAFGAALYFGVEGYLKSSLEHSLSSEAGSIASTFLAFEESKGPAWMSGEIVEAYAPEQSGRFIRITRQDHVVLFQSGDIRDPFIDTRKIQPPRISLAEAAFSRELTDHTHPLLLYSMPFTSSSGMRYVVDTGAPLAPVERVLSSLRSILLLITPLILMVAAVGGHFLMNRPLRPLVSLAEQAERIGAQGFGHRLQVIATGDEMERLSLSLNRMISRLEEALSHNRRFSADVSHELRTPLTILRGEMEQVIERGHLPSAVAESLGSALEEIDRLTKIVEDLLAISRLDSGTDVMERTTVDLGQLARWTADQMHLLADEKRLDLKIVQREPVWVMVDAGRIKQMFVNLLDNAIKYTPASGSITVTVSSSFGGAVIEVSDTGIGIPPASLPHVFDRFYRSDKARSRGTGGTGLGLSIVQAICNAHQSSVSVSSEEGSGTTVRVELPRPSALQKSAQAPGPLRLN